MLRLAAYKDTLCRCGCGLPLAEVRKVQPFLVDHYTCNADKAMKRKRRADEAEAKKNKWSEHWADGRHYFVTLPERQESQRAD